MFRRRAAEADPPDTASQQVLDNSGKLWFTINPLLSPEEQQTLINSVNAISNASERAGIQTSAVAQLLADGTLLSGVLSKAFKAAEAIEAAIRNRGRP